MKHFLIIKTPVQVSWIILHKIICSFDSDEKDYKHTDYKITYRNDGGVEIMNITETDFRVVLFYNWDYMFGYHESSKYITSLNYVDLLLDCGVITVK